MPTKSAKPTKPSKVPNNNRVRTKLVENLARCIVVLAASDDIEALDEMLALAGYSSVSNLHTSDDLGRAITALAPLLDLDELADVVHTGSCRVAIGNMDELDSLDAAERNARWDLANHTAATTLAECGQEVLKRFLVRFYGKTPTEQAAA